MWTLSARAVSSTEKVGILLQAGPYTLEWHLLSPACWSEALSNQTVTYAEK